MMVKLGGSFTGVASGTAEQCAQYIVSSAIKQHLTRARAEFPEVTVTVQRLS